MKVLISAGEASSDMHGAVLLYALKEQAGEPVEAFGMGGPRLRGEGLRATLDAREFLAMGTTEVLGRLPRIWRAIGELEAQARAERPDIAVLIDYPDFHLRLAKRLKAAGVRTVCFIPPKVWVWRKGRIKLLRDRFARVLCIFPFEADFFAREGLDAKYVGNPLLDELPLGMSREEARRKLDASPDATLIACLPGSRPAELNRHLPLFAQALAHARSSLVRAGSDAKWEVWMPFAETARDDEVRAWTQTFREAMPPGLSDVRLHSQRGGSATILRAADAGLIKSGTSVLEAAILDCPHCLVYRPSPVTSWIFKTFVGYRGPVGLGSLVAGELVVPELLMDQATPARLGDELARLLDGSRAAAEQRQRFERVREKLRAGINEGEGPARRAAREVLAVYRGQ